MSTSTSIYINGMAVTLYKKQHILPHADLLNILEESIIYPKFYWSSKTKSSEFIALGSLFSFNTVPTIKGDKDVKACGATAFLKSKGAHNWFGFPHTLFFIPRYLLERKGDAVVYTELSLDGRFPPLIASDKIHHQLDLCSSEWSHEPEEKKWHQSVESAKKAVEQNSIRKVVLARVSSASFSSSVSSLYLLNSLVKNQKNSTSFYISLSPQTAFLGATPEYLYCRNQNQLFSEAVAGTRNRGQSNEEDLKLEKELQSCSKEAEEFNIVKESIASSLTPLCKNLFFSCEDSILKTSNVQHLYNRLNATLLPSTTDKDIIKALHPTAAVGGLPNHSAKEFIENTESFTRGWYASPIGWISADKAEFAVGIRSCIVNKSELHIFAGTGIVKDSDPQKEWLELQSKVSLIQNLIS